MRIALPLILTIVLAVVVAGCDQNGMSAGEAESAELYVYTVESGDSDLRDVAEKVYGDRDMARHIAGANPGVDGENLREGDQLVIPIVQSEGGEAITPSGCDRQKLY